MKNKTSPRQVMNIIDLTEKKIWENYKSYNKVSFYIKRWHEEIWDAEGTGWNGYNGVNFEIDYKDKKGLARELARMNLTLNTYTQWYWKTDLLNLMNFLRLRADSHAQYEIRVYADIMLETLKKWVPTTYDAFMDYRVGGTEVSAKGKLIIQKLIKNENVDVESSGLSKREWNELMTAFDLKDKLI